MYQLRFDDMAWLETQYNPGRRVVDDYGLTSVKATFHFASELHAQVISLT